MNAALERRLREGADALGVSLGDRQVAQLLAYVSLLTKWNRVYNLTAIREPEMMVTHHVLDCLAILNPLRRVLGVRAASVLDVGSGGGLPGAVLATLEPDWKVDCVDTVAKKATFIQQVAGVLGLPNLRGVHARVETLGERYDLITCRAFASLGDFTRLSHAALAPTGIWAAMKGQRPDDEIAALPPEVSVFHVEQLIVPGLDAERCIVWMKPAES